MITQTELKMGEKAFDITRDRLWADGLAEAFEEARAKGKYLLIATGAEPAKSWKLGVALAFLEQDMLTLSRKFHCVIVNEKRVEGQRMTQTPAIMICTADGREIVTGAAPTIEELIPALRGMLEHVIAVEQGSNECVRCKVGATARPTLRHFVGMLAHAILGA